MEDMDLAIQTENLTKIYGRRLIAVNSMNWEVPKGAVFGLLGPNGAGKTTTLRLLLGLQRPTAGHAKVFGVLCGPSAVGVRSSVGYLPTNPKFPPHLRPIEYLGLLGRLSRLPREQREPRISTLLRAVGLLGATDQRIGTFSTGMCTRLGIAASLVADPPLLLWDEPTAGLDPKARRFTLDLVRKLGRTKTIVISTHILSDIDQVCDHVGVMHEGRMIFTGSMQDMKRRLASDDFILDFDGDTEAVERFADQLSGFDGVQVRVDAGGRLLLKLTDGHSRAGVLAEVLKQVEGNGLSLDTIHCGLNETENAYLQLLQEDEAHGFGR